jgi:hypothetical protein
MIFGLLLSRSSLHEILILQFIAMELQVVAAIHRMKAFFYCRILYLGLTLILLISHMVRSQTCTVCHATHYSKLLLSLSLSLY